MVFYRSRGAGGVAKTKLEKMAVRELGSVFCCGRDFADLVALAVSAARLGCSFWFATDLHGVLLGVVCFAALAVPAVQRTSQFVAAARDNARARGNVDFA